MVLSSKLSQGSQGLQDAISKAYKICHAFCKTRGHCWTLDTHRYSFPVLGCTSKDSSAYGTTEGNRKTKKTGDLENGIGSDISMTMIEKEIKNRLGEEEISIHSQSVTNEIREFVLGAPGDDEDARQHGGKVRGNSAVHLSALPSSLQTHTQRVKLHTEYSLLPCPSLIPILEKCCVPARPQRIHIQIRGPAQELRWIESFADDLAAHDKDRLKQPLSRKNPGIWSPVARACLGDSLMPGDPWGVSLRLLLARSEPSGRVLGG
ncbi:hypothetical protein SELMODRAFT_409995 [Selaginella moellendorffii]|uniref:Uncharacterized protein n=1 Tax=Selaginella moellendorffii TaxID=88036 RepID=D8RD46_SELML|nr:hypothetical protein SELMODRAFT_409995 [Selaginella moellendorffii]